MSDVYDRQKEQEEIQKSEDFLDIFSKVVSGKSGYKTIIEKKKIIVQCKNCGTVLDSSQKFCHECGTKVEKDT
ncbi:zinc-ribbon domain-containing protein [Candidatus Pacearchaeota archaeon]|nr:zinc-ribbon domain-containing protein [Candidatus Pacearchaeota archaeon]